MPTVDAWLMEIEVTYPLIHMGDVNTIRIDVSMVSCGVGKEQIDDTYDFVNTLIKSMENNSGKIKISIEDSKDENEKKPKIIKSAMSNLQ